jgi:hypothetical protein
VLVRKADYNHPTIRLIPWENPKLRRKCNIDVVLLATLQALAPREKHEGKKWKKGK